MEWIETPSLIAMLRRFADTTITARRGSDDRLPRHRLCYLHDKQRIVHRCDGCVQRTTTEMFAARYADERWRVEPFFRLEDGRQRDLAVRLVETLVMQGDLEWVISDCNIEFVRECEHCHRLIAEGWCGYNSVTYCSDECLMADNPAITQSRLRELEEDDGEDFYWTEWEE